MSNRITVTVTLDGRILIRERHETVELRSRRETQEVIAALTEAAEVQARIWPENPPQTLGANA
jgi:hypothetical protein